MASYKQETYCPNCKRNVTAVNDHCPRCESSVVKGNWAARLRVFKDGKYHETKISGFKTKRDAQARVAELSVESENEKRLYAARQDSNELSILTFDKLFADFMAQKKNVYKISSHYEFQQIGERLILPTFADKKVALISKRDIIDWQNSLTEQGYSYDYKCKLRGFLSNVFKFAMLYYDLPTNPVAAVPPFKRTEPKKEMHVWTPAQFKQFYDVIDEEKWKLFFAFAFFTGCRRGEIVALSWSDVNLTKCTVSIHKNLTRKVADKSYAIIPMAKTQSSNRTISIPTQLAQDLLAFKEANGFTDNDFVFAGDKPFHDNSINWQLDKYIKKATLPPIHMHEFRHSHASYLLAQPNITIVDVSKRLGHANITETLNTYSHVLPNGNEIIINFLDLNYPTKNL